MTKEYIILQSLSSKELASRISDGLKNGWELCGGVSITTRKRDNGSFDTIHAQALIRDIPKKSWWKTLMRNKWKTNTCK